MYVGIMVEDQFLLELYGTIPGIVLVPDWSNTYPSGVININDCAHFLGLFFVLSYGSFHNF